MLSLLIALRNVSLGLCVEFIEQPHKVKIAKVSKFKTRTERQTEVNKRRRIEFENSIRSQGIGYGYDFRTVKKHKPKRCFYGYSSW